MSISFPRPDESCPFYSLLYNYQCTGMRKSMSEVLGVHVVLEYVRLLVVTLISQVLSITGVRSLHVGIMHYVIKVLNIGYRDRIGWGFFISDIGYRGRYRGYARITDVHIIHYI